MPCLMMTMTFQVIDHFGKDFFPAMMVIVSSIVADKVDDIGKFFSDRLCLLDSAASGLNDFKHTGNIGVLFDHDFRAVS